MRIRLAVASLCIFVSANASAQLTGSFFLKKGTFARGEPIFLYLSLVNKGPDTAEIVIGDPDQPFCSGISITVSGDSSPAFCPSSRDSSCALDGQFRNRQLLSGQAYTMRFLLNFNRDIGAAGGYWVDAQYNGISNAIGGTHARLTFRVGAEPITSSEWKRWLEQLQSPELEERLEAARTLASLAPPSLEETLLGFANSAEFRKYSPMAFHRLNTRRSIEALAQFMEGPVTGEQIEAAHYLAETNEQRWYPLLRDAAEKNARISAYPTYAAELGGDKILPLLVALEKTGDTATHLNAVMAMGSTRSRAAIPILLDQLKSPDVDINDRASYALRLLTHRTAIQYSQSRNRRAEYTKWSRWWEHEGATGPIYGDSECGKVVPLP
jgi:hypothetical protein